MNPSQPASPGSSARPPARDPIGTLDLLMDMEMPVLVRLGSTRMLLRDLLALDAGSTVEFRRTPEEPVDLLVNGRVVARGTVVVVQGNYGVRITETASQREAGASGPGTATITPRGN